jgi:hypothetical protein
MDHLTDDPARPLSLVDQIYPLHTTRDFTMPPAQQFLKAQLELDILVRNYEIILGRSRASDPGLKSKSLRELDHSVFMQYTPELEADIHRLPISIAEKQRLQVIVDRLKQGADPKARTPTTGLRHQSPLVLLLYLALENGQISLSRETEYSNQKWGRLGAFSKYLGELPFEPHSSVTSGSYWPGVPSCLMTSFPIFATEQDFEVSIAASQDKFDSFVGLKACERKLRSARRRELRNSYDLNTQGKIQAVQDFSDTLRKTEKEEWRSLFNKSQDMSFKKWEPHDLKPHEHVPVYLPIVATTWTPVGEYKPACALDSIRFRFLRPPAAEKQEILSKEIESKNTRIPTATGCAEWECFLSIMAQQIGGKNPVWY